MRISILNTYAAHINELLRSLNVSGEAEAQPEAGETEE